MNDEGKEDGIGIGTGRKSRHSSKWRTGTMTYDKAADRLHVLCLLMSNWKLEQKYKQARNTQEDWADIWITGRRYCLLVIMRRSAWKNCKTIEGVPRKLISFWSRKHALRWNINTSLSSFELFQVSLQLLVTTINKSVNFRYTF